jgi:hypothetical protein
MLFRTLLEGQFQPYCAALMAGTPLWLFVHVPKTAGSSLNGELMPILQPNFHILVDYSQLDRRPFNEMLDEAVENFIASAAIKPYAYATGHITAGHVSRIVHSIPRTAPVTLLRDPVARFVSDYRYQCSQLHPGHESFKARHPTIESYIDMPGEKNKAATHLVPAHLRGGHDPQAAAEHILDTYAFIGIQELYPLSLRALTTLIGAPTWPKVFKRVNTPTEDSAVHLSSAIEERIRDLNALDIAIYDAIAPRFKAIAAELTAYLDVIDPMQPGA